MVSEKLADLHRQALAQLEKEKAYKLTVAERFMAVSAEQGQYLNFMVGLTRAQVRSLYLRAGCWLLIVGSEVVKLLFIV